jgi:hypothetical protein
MERCYLGGRFLFEHTQGSQFAAMKDKKFKSAVAIEPRWGRIRVAATTRQAAILLLREWPHPRGRRHSQAMKACLLAMKGEKPPYVARKAFLKAAEEAGILAAETDSLAGKANSG